MRLEVTRKTAPIEEVRLVMTAKEAGNFRYFLEAVARDANLFGFAYVYQPLIDWIRDEEEATKP